MLTTLYWWPLLNKSIFFKILDSIIFGDKDPHKSREELLKSLVPFCNRLLNSGIRLHNLARHMSGLFKGQPRAKRWRIRMQELLNQNPQNENFLKQSMEVFYEPWFIIGQAPHDASVFLFQIYNLTIHLNRRC